MKNNRIMKAAGALLVLVLVTSCFVGSTFAKYTTAGTGTDSARVAKFGVKIEANGSTFAKEYATDDQSVVGTIAKSVVSSNDEKLVAPGTKGSMVSMTITGKPEVAVNVQYAATLTLNDKWKDAQGNFYCPLQIKVNTGDGNEVYYGLDYASATLFAQAVQDAISKANAKYEANTDLTTTAVTPAVSWEWAYEGAGAHTVAQTDEKDTYLGDQAAEGNAADIQLTVITTVTQIN